MHSFKLGRAVGTPTVRGPDILGTINSANKKNCREIWFIRLARWVILVPTHLHNARVNWNLTDFCLCFPIMEEIRLWILLGNGKGNSQFQAIQYSLLNMKVKVAQLCPTLGNFMDYIQIHGILQARILEWVTFPFSRGSSQPSHRTQVSSTAGGFFTTEPSGSPVEYICRLILFSSFSWSFRSLFPSTWQSQPFPNPHSHIFS